MLNPPAGGVVALCVISNPTIDSAGWIFIIPIMLWSCCCILIALLIINLDKNALYPMFWIKKFNP